MKTSRQGYEPPFRPSKLMVLSSTRRPESSNALRPRRYWRSGISWLFESVGPRIWCREANLTKSLLKLGYKDNASGTSEITSGGRLLSDMAKAPFLRDVTNYLADQPDIEAVLVGAGCNDLVAGLPGQQPLYKMLKPLREGDDPLDEAAVAGFIDGALFTYYDTVIKTLTANSKIPVIIHGYDHPIPDGSRDIILIDPSGPWLLPSFEDRGYHINPKSQHLTLASEVMKRLIDRLNAAIKKAAGAIRIASTTSI